MATHRTKPATVILPPAELRTFAGIQFIGGPTPGNRVQAVFRASLAGLTLELLEEPSDLKYYLRTEGGELVLEERPFQSLYVILPRLHAIKLFGSVRDGDITADEFAHQCEALLVGLLDEGVRLEALAKAARARAVVLDGTADTDTEQARLAA
jgi:hypothetical protein